MSDTNREPGQTGPPGVGPIITVNEPEKVRRLPDKNLLAHPASEDDLPITLQPSLLFWYTFVFFLTHLKVAPSVDRSGRMNLFSLMQSISELKDEDVGLEQVNEAVCWEERLSTLTVCLSYSLLLL